MKRKLFLIVASLLLGGTVFAQNLHWSGFNYNAFQSYMPIIGRVYLDGVLQQDRENIEVAAFVGDQLRGTSLLVEPYPNSTLGYFIWTPCYYDTEGETFTFKAFDHASGIEYEICPTELLGQASGHGSVSSPVEMYFTSTGNPFVGPTGPWTPVVYPGEGMLVVAQVKINGAVVDNANWEVGAFCGDECRGTSGDELEDWTDVNLGYFAYLKVMGNDGDVINFYLYDKANSEVYEAVCTTTVDLVNGGELGLDIMGGDIFILDFESSKTFTKTINAYSGDGGYYLIASPVGTINPTKVGKMLDNSYDLYYFDQTKELEWINYKDATNGNYDLEPGQGYLYANSQTITLSFKGFPYTGDIEFPLTYGEYDLQGYNLIGNPLTVAAYINKDFFRMNAEGTEVEVECTAADTIGVMEGVFVLAENANETVSFSTEPYTKANQQLVLNLTSNRGSSIDRAIVRFSEGRALPKFQINKNHTKLYIPQSGKDYAIVNADNSGELPVSFEAAQNGNYTISFNTENVSLGYLHLIDNKTGEDVDLLNSMSYTFTATVGDYASRFKLVFATGNSEDGNFAFFSNGNLVINNNGAATLQVIDVTGRIISTRSINGCCNVSVDAAAGVYTIRLINGSDVKTQKIIVR